MFSNLPESIKNKLGLLTENYDFEKQICVGANGYVFLAKNKLLLSKVIIKFYYWENGTYLEPKTLNSMQHENIINVLYAEQVDEDYAYFITPFCPLGNLDDYLMRGRFNTLYAIDIIMQIASGVSYIHSSGHVHRDLKPSNIFVIDDKKCVIGDFGSVSKINQSGYSTSQSKHSLIYRPPEDFKGDHYFTQGDIYQIGILFYQLLGGKLSYSETDWLNKKQFIIYMNKDSIQKQLYAKSIISDKILKSKILDFKSLPIYTSPAIKSVIRKCCHKDKSARFQNISDLISKLSNLRGSIKNWSHTGNEFLHRNKAKSIRIVDQTSGILIQKKSTENKDWRNVKQFKAQSMAEAIEYAENAIS